MFICSNIFSNLKDCYYVKDLQRLSCLVMYYNASLVASLFKTALPNFETVWAKSFMADYHLFSLSVMEFSPSHIQE